MSDLILVPTPGELKTLRALWAPPLPPHDWAFQVCGFGPVAAAARAAALISRYKPARVMLIGIGGTFEPERAPLGTACRFDAVLCDGVGVGGGPQYQSAATLGWPQFCGEDAEPHIGDHIRLESSFVEGLPAVGTLLSCCCASADAAHARTRKTAYPDAVVEDMEGYAVALACGLALVPLQIVRGISNVVGDRDHSHWSVQAALESAAKLAMELAMRPWLPSPA